MLDRYARSLKDGLLAPAAHALGSALHPNAVTLFGFGVGLGCAWLALEGRYLAALALWLLNRVLDGLDGVLARHQGTQSDFGGYLDVFLDFAIYALLPLALAWGAPPERGLWISLALLLGSFYLNAASWMYLSALLEKRERGAAARGEETSVTMPPGLVEGTETIVLFSLYFLLPGHLASLFALTAGLVLLTALQRLAWARRAL